MTIASRPAAEITLDEPMVRALLDAQHPDLAHLPLGGVAEGWDNQLFRLGDDLTVRIPRRGVAASLIAKEQQWLPRLAPSLPLPVPVPMRVGCPSGNLPWPWSITPWFEGQPALLQPPVDPMAAAIALGRFLRALHQPAPDDAPRNPWRGVPIETRTEILEQRLEAVSGVIDEVAVLQVWEVVLAARPWTGPSLWIHGDLHPGNLIVSEGRLSAVIDFGDLTAGDPATDLSVMWMLLPATVREAFVTEVRSAVNPVDEDTLMRARGWAVALGVAIVSGSGDDPSLMEMGVATVRAATAE
jgi:aminoglycoside phosphotransferase (APT) family kinase protein